MNGLAPYQQNLPEKIEDVATFLLIAPAKLAKVKAEIRAITNAKMANAVLRQKRVEERMLGEAIIDAKVKVGEFTKQIPTSDGGRPCKTSDSAVASYGTKEEAINSLGFSRKQVERMETLADNQDLVEQVKAEARESETMPTATKVIELAQERKRIADIEKQRDIDEINRNYDNLKKFRKALSNPALYGIVDDFDEILLSVKEVATDYKSIFKDIDRYISILTVIKNKLITMRGKQNDIQ